VKFNNDTVGVVAMGERTVWCEEEEEAGQDWLVSQPVDVVVAAILAESHVMKRAPGPWRAGAGRACPLLICLSW
jgi:hypothetical protein